jgi:hypothetical protein
MQLIIDFIRGLTIGFEYLDDYEENDGTIYFMVAIHILLIRIIFQWEK